ncbi:MAG: zf-HC2 domain-containing protein [Frankiales bacterium]|nr:zf-HC2 domain-containing protein [Frankiales bacterium]
MMSIRQALECRRTRKRLQRFLDRDPSALLTTEEVREVEVHLQGCVRCQGLAEEYRSLHRSLGRLGDALTPDDDAVRRAQEALRRATESIDRPEA